MGHRKDNNELRTERAEQEKRQEVRDEAFEQSEGTDNLGSQDERRKEGLGHQ